MTLFGRHLTTSLEHLAQQALNAALTDAGAERSHVDAVFYSGVTASVLTGQTAIPGQIVMGAIGLPYVPVINVENACASGTSAFHLAVQAVSSGSMDVAVAIGAEKMNVADKARALQLFEGGWDVSTIAENEAVLLALGEGVDTPEGSESTRPYSRFMAIYAAVCRYHMKTYGLTQRQLAAVSAKNHRHSVHNPYAQYRQALTIDEVLAAPPITYPLTMPMCSPVSDGAAAVIVVNNAGLRRLGHGARRTVRVAASVLRTAGPRTPEPVADNTCRRAADAAYAAAGIGPEDVHVAEVHDATAMGEVSVVEKLGFVTVGEGGAAAEQGNFDIGGRLPVNPSGGLESKGHPIGATGLGQIHELVTQ
ncbi:MAG: thiolase family protein, partial [Lysobacteraceae bacterium]